MINIAVIGVGNIGKHHARNYYELPTSNLVAISDLNETIGKELAKKYSCKFYKDYKEMLKKEDIDAISIAVPTSLHKQVALDVLNANKHILLEKPIADTIKNAEEIIKKAKEKNLKLMVGHIERFNPAITKLKSIIDEGQLGDITTVMVRRVGLYPPQIKENVVIDLAIHDIDIFNYLLNSLPSNSYCLTGKALVNQKEDYADILLKYNNTNAFIQVNWITPIKIRKLNITGTKGYAELDYITQELTLYKSNYKKEFNDFEDVVKFSKPDKIEIGVENKEPLKAEIEAFLTSIEEDKEPPVTGQEALEALRIANSIL